MADVTYQTAVALARSLLADVRALIAQVTTLKASVDTTATTIATSTTTVSTALSAVQTIQRQLNGTLSNKASSGVNDDITNLTGLTVAIPVSSGGTGAKTAAQARTNLGAASLEDAYFTALYASETAQ